MGNVIFGEVWEQICLLCVGGRLNHLIYRLSVFADKKWLKITFFTRPVFSVIPRNCGLALDITTFPDVLTIVQSAKAELKPKRHVYVRFYEILTISWYLANKCHEKLHFSIEVQVLQNIRSEYPRIRTGISYLPNLKI